jgi:FlaA1/EpsC-like NDP-sugar epimerase
MITLEQGVELVWKAFDDMLGGEIYVKKIPSMTIIDIANAVLPNAKIKIIGIRPGEKIHEQMIGFEDAPHTFEYDSFYKILPAIHNWSNDSNRIKNGKKVDENFTYSSDNNKDWMKIADLGKWIEINNSKIGKI